MRTRKPYFAGSIPTAPLYWFLPQSLRYIGAGVWSYVSGFLAELHSSIWRLWPCILAILRDKITSLIGNLLHNFKFLFFYPCLVPLSSTMDFGFAGGYISEHHSHFGSRYKLGCCGHASLILQVRFPPLPFIGFSPNPSGTSGQVCGPMFLGFLPSFILPSGACGLVSWPYFGTK